MARCRSPGVRGVVHPGVARPVSRAISLVPTLVAKFDELDREVLNAGTVTTLGFDAGAFAAPQCKTGPWQGSVCPNSAHSRRSNHLASVPLFCSASRLWNQVSIYEDDVWSWCCGFDQRQEGYVQISNLEGSRGSGEFIFEEPIVPALVDDSDALRSQSVSGSDEAEQNQYCLLEDNSFELRLHRLSGKRGKTKPSRTTSLCTLGSASRTHCSLVNSTTRTRLSDTRSYVPFRHKSLSFHSSEHCRLE